MSGIQNISADMTSAMSSSGGGSKKSIAMEAQDRFMTLLVTQMKNQDPLNPLDNAQVTSQLAQLSTVTGIDKLNVALEALIQTVQSGQSLQATSMIGRRVLMPGSELALANNKAAFGIELAEPADQMTVSIRDNAGNTLRTLELGPRNAGIASLEWDGKTATGAAAADGKYTFEVTAIRGSEKIAAAPLAAVEVLSVSSSARGINLNIAGGREITLADVRQIL